MIPRGCVLSPQQHEVPPREGREPTTEGSWVEDIAPGRDPRERPRALGRDQGSGSDVGLRSVGQRRSSGSRGACEQGRETLRHVEAVSRPWQPVLLEGLPSSATTKLSKLWRRKRHGTRRAALVGPDGGSQERPPDTDTQAGPLCCVSPGPPELPDLRCPLLLELRSSF